MNRLERLQRRQDKIYSKRHSLRMEYWNDVSFEETNKKKIVELDKQDEELVKEIIEVLKETIPDNPAPENKKDYIDYINDLGQFTFDTWLEVLQELELEARGEC